MTLSQNRARSVADYLSSRGVARRASVRRAMARPSRSPRTPPRKAAPPTRRVEIKIVPVTQDDVARARGHKQPASRATGTRAALCRAGGEQAPSAAF
jgi:hypothetical protein